MAPRAVWKGHLRIAELSCPVALYAAASTSGRVALQMVNRDTGNPLRREYVDVETEEPVDKDDQVKGYETAKDAYVILTPEDMATAVPESDKTLDVEAFLGCSDVDTTYFDKPYYVAPADPGAAAAFAVIREGMRKKGSAALARAVLFRRVRTVLIRAQGPGLVANTLNFDYEVRPSETAFKDLPDPKIEPEMLELAEHIITTKSGVFDPAAFDDRYDAALAALVKAKAAGKPIPKPAPREEPKPVSLLEALRASAGRGGTRDGGGRKKPPAKGGKPARKSGDAPRRKAG